MTSIQKISIVVPVYNVEAFVAQCLNSLIQQSSDAFECIVVDDGSTDRSIEIARNVFGEDPRFRLISQANGGLSDARNTGMRNARGSHIVFLDSDDYLTPFAIEMLLRHLDSVPGDVVQFFSTDFDDTCGITYPRSATDGLAWPLALETQAQKLSTVPNWASLPVPAWTRCYSRGFLQEFQFPKGLYFEDNLLYFYLLAKDPLVSVLRVPLYRYRVRVGSITKPSSGSLGPRHQTDIRAVFVASKELLVRENRSDLLPFLQNRMRVQVADVDGRVNTQGATRRKPRWAGILPHALYRRLWGES